MKKLIDLHKKYPNYTFSQHLSTCTCDYKDIWGLPDKELFLLIEKYESELESNIESELSLSTIIDESMNLNINSLLEDNED